MLKIKRNDLIVINNLVRAGVEDDGGGIDKYMIELNKKEKALFVEQFSPDGLYAICLRKEMDNIITKDELIPIFNSIELDDILSKVIEDDEIDLFVKDNKVIIETSNRIIEMPYFEEDDDDKQSRENVKTAFKTRKYGNKKNILTFYERADKEDPMPDALCKIDLKRLNIKNITTVFDKGAIEIGAKKEKFYLTIGGGKQKLDKNIIITIKKEEDRDPTNIKGESFILLQDTSCLSLLSEFSGFVNIDMKEDFPLVIKKKIPEHRIGVCYLISLLEEIDEAETEAEERRQREKASWQRKVNRSKLIKNIKENMDIFLNSNY